jgi:hypothetical protein
MTPISLTLNSTTEEQEIANFVHAISAQFKKAPDEVQQVYINGEPWVVRDFLLGTYLTVGTIDQYEKNKNMYVQIIAEGKPLPVYNDYFKHLRVNGDVGETMSPLLEGYEHNPSTMSFDEIIGALTRLGAKY